MHVHVYVCPYHSPAFHTMNLFPHSRFMIQGGEVQITPKQRDLEAVVYKAEWLTTGLEKCKKGSRNKLQLLMQVHWGGHMLKHFHFEYAYADGSIQAIEGQAFEVWISPHHRSSK